MLLPHSRVSGVLGHVSKGHVWHAEDSVFLLHSSAVGENGESVLLQLDEV